MRPLTVPERLALVCASALARMLQPWLRRKLMRRARTEPLYGSNIPQRFGQYDDESSSGWCWIHAVSLGETRAAGILVEHWRTLNPHLRLLLTHGTATGMAAGKELLRPGDRQAWLPWDTASATRAFLRHFRPRIGVLIETEVWPNLVAACREAEVPLILANARLNETSLRKGQRLRWLSRPAYGGLTQVWAQSGADAERLAALGAVAPQVLGNLKQDARPDARLVTMGRGWRQGSDRPVLMLASSREGEEPLWLQALSELRSTRPDLDAVQWLVVPRHPQRVDEVERLIRQAGWVVARRSQWDQGPPTGQGLVWLGDTMGEMAAYYSLSDVALLGGSFATLGGQNLLEAAACGCPVVMGPHTFNFAQAAEQSLQAGASKRVADMNEAVRAALDWVAHADARQQASVQALAFAAAGSGVAVQMARRLQALCEQSAV